MVWAPSDPWIWGMLICRIVYGYGPLHIQHVLVLSEDPQDPPKGGPKQGPKQVILGTLLRGQFDPSDRVSGLSRWFTTSEWTHKWSF